MVLPSMCVPVVATVLAAGGIAIAKATAETCLHISKVICKILYSSTSIHVNSGHGLPAALTRPGAMERTLDYLLALQQRTIPDVGNDGGEEEDTFWGPQKWSTRLWMRMLSMYSMPAQRHLFPPALALDSSEAAALSSRTVHRILM